MWRGVPAQFFLRSGPKVWCYDRIPPTTTSAATALAAFRSGDRGDPRLGDAVADRVICTLRVVSLYAPFGSCRRAAGQLPDVATLIG